MKSFKLVRNRFTHKDWQKSYFFNSDQCYSQRFGLNPDSIRSVDPGSESDPDTDPGGENDPQK
jgi:hypothetical protein